MEDSLYSTPQSELMSEQRQDELYVVSKTKFLVLYFATMGLYVMYWFYKNWSLYENSYKENIWPVARGIFTVFFAQALFFHVDVKVKEVDKNYSWRPAGLAACYIILTVVTHIVGRLSSRDIGSPYTDIISILLMPFIAIVLLKVQLAINIAMGDAEASVNNHFTAANIGWVLFGFIFWAFACFGFLIMFGIVQS